MSVSFARGGRRPSASAQAQAGHIRSQEQGYGPSARKVNRPGKLSPTRQPSGGPDAELWPAWTRTPITRAFTVLHEDGSRVVFRGGC